MNLVKSMISDKAFMGKTLMIALPIAVQNMLNNSVNFVDTLMIGQLGETTVAAVGLANRFFFVFMLLIFGISSGSSILASQYWGKKELLNIRKALRIGLLLGVGASVMFAIPAIFFPEVVMRVFTDKPDTIALGAQYLRVIGISYPLTAITTVYVSILRSMNYVRQPVVITSIAIVVNVFFNYGFIFGNLGFPEMGVAGAALATLIARVVECVLVLCVVYSKKAGDQGIGDFIHTKFDNNIKGLKRYFDKTFVQTYIRCSTAVIANEFMWGLGVTMYSLVYGRMGNQATAAITITNNIEQVILVFFFGICSAASVILGNALGANEFEKAKRYSKYYMLLQISLSMVALVFTLLIRTPVISLFNVSPEAAGYIYKCLTIFAFFIPIRMTNVLIVVAILRCGGDTKAALFLDVSGVWLIGLPMAILGGLVLGMPVYIVYAMVVLEEIYKLTLGIIRYRKGKWVKNIVSAE